MSLSAALSTARNSLKTNAGQMNVASVNLSGMQDVNYTRRSSYVQSGAYGLVYATVVRDSDPQLLGNYISKNSQSYAASAFSNGLDQLYEVYGADDYSHSPATLLSEFQEALQFYANNASQTSAGDAAISAAQDLVTSLNSGAKQITELRNQADKDIKDSVDNINNLLQQFQEVDNAIFKETARNGDPYSYMDQRDAILKELSSEIGITTVTNKDGSTTIYGLDGSTLYDKTPRKVTFDPSENLSAGKTGNQVYIDGVPLSHSSFSDPYGSGSIGGLLQFRDETTVEYQAQLDQTAQALFDMFSGVGLFTDGRTNNPTTPAGLAENIILNKTKFDSNSGGSPTKLGTAEEIQALADKFDEKRNYTTNTALANNQSILSYASNSSAWLDAQRSNATSDSQYKNTMSMRATEALSNATGVNQDDELAMMLQLEQSYSATTRIINTIGQMLDDLMAAI